MKKIFLTLVISLAVIFTTQILEDNPVFAQDVYVGSTGGLDFFVDTNTITVAGEADGTVYYTFYVKVKKVYSSTQRLADVNQWKFYTAYLDDDIGTWVFDYYLSGTRIPVRENAIARNILDTCRRYNRHIAS